MGKIKVRTLGGETEEQEKKEQKEKSEQKKLEKKTEEAVESPVEPEQKEEVKTEAKKEKKSKFKKEKRARSKNYQNLFIQIENKPLALPYALGLLEKLQRKTFDETVELHLNTKSDKVSAETSLPHGTGKTLKVAIASDDLIAEVEKGIVAFDVLLAEPSMMPKLAKVAKVLGPRGLMPNPKNGTITNNPQETAKKYEGGLTFIKTEAKAPIIHVAVGKISFGSKKLEENINTVLSAVKKENIEKAVLKSTMSPAIKLQV